MLWRKNNRTRNWSIICRQLFWPLASPLYLVRGRALKPQQVRISIPWCSPGCPCCTLSSGSVRCKQFPVCVAVNEVFGNRERLILASANSVASSSTASSSSNDLETAMESWWTKHQRIKLIMELQLMCVLQMPVWWELVERTLVSCSLRASSSQRKVVVWLSSKLQPLSPALKDWINSL